MSFDDDMLAGMHGDLFAAMGVDGAVQRGTGTPLPVRIIVDRDQQQMGEFGVAAARIDTVDFLVAQWSPRGGDIVEWTDRLGSHARRIDVVAADDGFVARAVLHG